MRYHAKSHTVIYRTKMHRVLKRNFEVFPVLDWIAAVTAHIPNKGEHLVRYYGWVSNVTRGKHRKAEEPTQQGSPDPLLRPRCGGTKRIIAPPHTPPLTLPRPRRHWLRLSPQPALGFPGFAL